MKTLIYLLVSIALAAVKLFAQDELRITFPNGGEKFNNDENITITWEGSSPQDTLSIEYSTDSGENWHLITDKATGTSYEWAGQKEISAGYMLRINQNENPFRFEDKQLLGYGDLDRLALSPDGATIAAAGATGCIYLFDFQSRSVKDTIGPLEGAVKALEYSSDGSILAAAIGTDVLLINTEDHQITMTLQSEFFDIRAISWDNTGTRLAGAEEDKLLIWYTQTGEIIRKYDDLVHRLYDVEWSPDGSLIAVADESAAITVFDAAGGMETGSYQSDGFIIDIAWNHSSTKLAATANDDTGYSIIILNSDLQGTPQKIEGLHANRINCLSWSSDDSKIASSDYDGMAIVSDANTGQLLKSFGLMTEYFDIWKVLWHPSDDYLITADEFSKINIWNYESGILEEVIDSFKDIINDMIWISREELLVVYWNEILLHNFSTMHSESFNFAGYGYNKAAIDPGSSNIAVSAYDTVYIFNKLNGQMQMKLSGFDDDILSLDFSPDGTKIAASSWDNTIRLWDTQTGDELLIIDEHMMPVTSLDFSPDGTKLASASEDETVVIWNTQTGDKLKSFTGSYFSAFVEWSPDGSLLMSGGADYPILIRDSEDGTTIAQLDGEDYGVESADWSPNGSYIANGGFEGNINIWETGAFTLAKKIEEYDGFVSGLAWSPNSEWLAAGTTGGVLKLHMIEDRFDLTDGTFEIKDALTVRHYALRNISLYPNPAAKELNIDLGNTLLSPPLKAEICSARGEIMMNFRLGKLLNKIDISGLPAGSCYLRLFGSKGESLGHLSFIISK
ncbi:MAG: hypothetical protein ACLFQU_00050 [Candidatus Kapaibacterium sp.]